MKKHKMLILDAQSPLPNLEDIVVMSIDKFEGINSGTINALMAAKLNKLYKLCKYYKPATGDRTNNHPLRGLLIFGNLGKKGLSEIEKFFENHHVNEQLIVLLRDKFLKLENLPIRSIAKLRQNKAVKKMLSIALFQPNVSVSKLYETVYLGDGPMYNHMIHRNDRYSKELTGLRTEIRDVIDMFYDSQIEKIFTLQD